MKLKRIMIAAPKSGSGKTTVTCVLLQALIDRNYKVFSCKCGPDYIDPMFHEKVIGVPSKNLDTFFTDKDKTRELFIKDRSEEDFVVLEGVMGLYDGAGGIREEGSSYHLAESVMAPVILVVDAKGMGWSVIPLIAGFLSYDKSHLIRGVILNRMSEHYYNILKPFIESELHIKPLGYFPEQKDLRIKGRHLGLIMPGELEQIKERLKIAAGRLEKTVCIEEIIKTAECAEGLDDSVCGQAESNKRTEQFSHIRPIIAVAKDEAFCFYYEDNLRMLEELGAGLQYFSPVHDEELPKDCHAVLLGGGYPELYAEKLSANVSMRVSIKQAVEKGMPVVAECGGFLYLHEQLIDENGAHYAMAGVIPAVCSCAGKLVRFGYIELQEKCSRFLPEGGRIKGHEFHYYDSTCNGEDCIARKPVTGKEYLCVTERKNGWFGFPHLYYPSNPAFAEKFVKMAQEYRAQIQKISLLFDCHRL